MPTRVKAASAPRVLTATNAQIVNAVRDNASLQYRERIPIATQRNLAKVYDEVRNYTPFWNEFQSVLIERIGLSMFNWNTFVNKLKPLKLGMLQYGGMIQEIGAHLLKAEEYSVNATDVFKQNIPDAEVNYHKINRRNVYRMFLSEDMLEEAFLEDGQLSAYINGLLALPQQSDEWDEYIIMRDLLKEAYEAGDFANIQVNDIGAAEVADIEDDSKDLVANIRETYLNLKDFYKTAYNPLRIETVSRELILLTTPRVMARNDVYNLASAYNMDKAEWVADRVIVVDDFGIPGCQAILLDADAYRCADTLVRTTSIPNPLALGTNYFLHHQGIYSLSRMRNMVMFSTNEGNITAVAPKTVTSVAIALATPVDNNAVLEPGAEIPLAVTVTYGDSTTDANAYIVLTGTTEGAPVDTTAPNPPVILPDTGTYVDRHNVLHVADSEDYTTITATAYATADGKKLASITLQKVGYTPGA